MKTLALPLIAALALACAAEAATGFETEKIVLYQTDEVLRARLSSVEDLAAYTERLQKVCTEFFASTAKPETLDIVIALKPGKQSRVWFVSSTRPDSRGLEPLRQRLQAVPAIDVLSGPVVYAISARIAGGSPRDTKGFGGLPIPQEWQAAAKDLKPPIPVPEGFLRVVWPDPAEGAPQSPGAAPTEFVTQVLEPTGGKIPRPKDWFYVEGHRKNTYMWTLSREDSSQGQPYTTGVRIQTFIGVKAGTGKTGKEFVLDFVAAKKKEAETKVLKTCGETNQGLFTRICLETEEGPYHILYSLFWGSNNLDVVVISIAGTTRELWSTYLPTFDKMSAFELIDMKRFEK